MNELEKEFVPYEESLELKELGFDEPCLLFIQYDLGHDTPTGVKFKTTIWFGNGEHARINGEKIKYKFPLYSNKKYWKLDIPTFSQAFRFFREKYSLHHLDLLSLLFLEQKMNYEEAELECLKKLIEIVKNSSPTN